MLEAGSRTMTVDPKQAIRLREGEAPEHVRFTRWPQSKRFAKVLAELKRNRDDRIAWGQRSYLPPALHAYHSLLHLFGTWYFDAKQQPYWVPRVDMSWQPYSNGEWIDTPDYGLVWTSPEIWSWPTHHHGRWTMDAYGTWAWRPPCRSDLTPLETAKIQREPAAPPRHSSASAPTPDLNDIVEDAAYRRTQQAKAKAEQDERAQRHARDVMRAWRRDVEEQARRNYEALPPSSSSTDASSSSSSDSSSSSTSSSDDTSSSVPTRHTSSDSSPSTSSSSTSSSSSSSGSSGSSSGYAVPRGSSSSSGSSSGSSSSSSSESKPSSVPRRHP